MELDTLVGHGIKLQLLGFVIQYLVFSDEITKKDLTLTTDKSNYLDNSNPRLLNDTGCLIENGWHPTPFKKIEPSDFYPVTFGFKPLTWMKYKTFEFHKIEQDEHVLLFAAGHASYTGSVFMVYFNYKTGELIEDTALTMPWNLPQVNPDGMKFKGGLDYTSGGLKLKYDDLYFKLQDSDFQFYS